MVGAISGIRNYDNWMPRVNTAAAGRMESAAEVMQGKNSAPVQTVESLTHVRGDAEQLTYGQLPPVREGADPAEMAVRMRIKYMDENGEEEQVNGKENTKSPQEVMEEETCQTCEERKYQDGSDDPGVSFKTPSHIDSDVSACVVRGHEQEHVVREQAAAKREGREVVQQSVTLHNAICPECGKVYTSGGTTRTTTAEVQRPEQESNEKQQQQGASFEAVA